MNPSDALNTCLSRQADLLEAFVQALEVETSLLLNDPSNEALSKLSSRKSEHAKQLAALDEQRASLLRELGHDDSTTGIQKACESHPELQQSFDRLRQLTKQAQQSNQQNGQILQTLMEHNQRAIDTLHALMNDDLYDARGRLPRK